MFMITTRESAGLRTGVLLTLFRPFNSLAAVIAREIRIRRDMRSLSTLDDAALHDIGLVRGGVEDAVRHGRSPQFDRLESGRIALTSGTLIKPMADPEWC